jgi:hypothetical protein
MNKTNAELAAAVTRLTAQVTQGQTGATHTSPAPLPGHSRVSPHSQASTTSQGSLLRADAERLPQRLMQQPQGQQQDPSTYRSALAIPAPSDSGMVDSVHNE